MTKITFQRTPDFKPAVAIKKEDNFQEVLDLFSSERSADIIRMACLLYTSGLSMWGLARISTGWTHRWKDLKKRSSFCV